MTTSKIIWTSFILCFIPCSVYSQGKFVQKFRYLAQTQIEDVKVAFTFYYIVDSSVNFTYKGVMFYQFTFSEDSTDKNGFIGYDNKSGDLHYAIDSNKSTKDNFGKLFRLKTNGKSTISHIMALNNELIKRTGTNTVTFVIRLSGPIKDHDSHSIYLEQIEFKKGVLYPINMTFFFPFDRGSTILLPE